MLLLLQQLLHLIVAADCASDAAVTVGASPTWRWFNYSSEECQCGSDVGGTINCSEGNSSVYARFDVCVSWDTQSGTVLMNFCKYKKKPPSTAIDRVFFIMSDNPHNLSYDECELNNREGILCSRCKQGFAPSIHIFRGKCTCCIYLSVVYIFVLIFLSYIFSKPTVKAKIVSCRVCKNILFMWTR